MAVTDTEPVPAEKAASRDDLVAEAKSFMAQGRRFMAINDIQSAADAFEHACQIHDAVYTIGKRQCADAYLEYGISLVALANLEAGSGKLMPKSAHISPDTDEDEDDDDDDESSDDVEDNDDDDEDECQGQAKRIKATPKESPQKSSDSTSAPASSSSSSTQPPATSATSSEQKDEAMEQEEKVEKEITNKEALSGSDTINADQDEKSGDEKSSEPETSEDNKMDQSSEIKSNESKPKEGEVNSEHQNLMEPQPGPSTSDGGSAKPTTNADDDEDDDDDEPTTIEVAWEVLCLAKRVFELDETREGRLKLAETLQRLGEISIEWDNNENAVSILEECLRIRTAHLFPDDRLIALTYYHLGLAHSFKNETQLANGNFQNAVKVIENRLSAQTERLEKAKEAGDTGAISAYMKEINELKELLPDMLMRIDDSKEDAEKSTEVIKRTREEQEKEDQEMKKVCSDKTKPVDDISHLVKRRA